jgi:hypothetical protein
MKPTDNLQEDSAIYLNHFLHSVAGATWARKLARTPKA